MQDSLDMFRKQCGKVLCVRREWPSVIPLNSELQGYGCAIILQALRLNLLAFEIQGAWDNGDAIGCFGERRQRGRRSSFEANNGCNASNAANGVERYPRGLASIANQDRHSVQSPQIHYAAGAEVVA